STLASSLRPTLLLWIVGLCSIRPHLPLELHPPTSTLLPYTTLFRSQLLRRSLQLQRVGGPRGGGPGGVARDSPRDRSATPLRRRSEEHTFELQSPDQLVCRLRGDVNRGRRLHHQYRLDRDGRAYGEC